MRVKKRGGEGLRIWLDEASERSGRGEAIEEKKGDCKADSGDAPREKGARGAG